MFKVIDTHTHFDAEEFDEDRAEAFARAREAGVSKVFLPAIDVKTTHAVLALSKEYPGYAYPMIGLHPEEVKEDWKEQLAELRKMLEEHRMIGNANSAGESDNANSAGESGNANPAGDSPQFLILSPSER